MTIASDEEVPHQKQGVSGRTNISRRVRLRQFTARSARWLHLYLSMVSFGIILFFAVTGLTLNHSDWFASAMKTRQMHGQLNPALLHADSSAIIRTLRLREHLHGTVDEPRIDDSGVSFTFKAPGYSADVTVDRPAGTYTVTEVRNGFAAVMNDLHRGHDAGHAWSLLIDACAILLTLVSLTGLLLLWFVYKRRSSGLVLASLGIAFCLLLYRVLVP